MNKGKTIFSQIMSLIPERDFKTCVDRYKGNYNGKDEAENGHGTHEQRDDGDEVRGVAAGALLALALFTLFLLD